MLRQTLATAVVTAGVLGGGYGSVSSWGARSPRAAADVTASAVRSTTGQGAGSATPLLTRLTHVSTIGSTVPANGDVNPYGIATVRSTRGRLRAGDLLISNFNNRANQQGTGTTVVELSPTGRRSTFAHITSKLLPGRCPGGVGLTTALDVLPGGYVVVGSLPTSNGKSATMKAGCLIVLNSAGHPVSTIAGPMIQGPWDSTVVSHGSSSTLFVSMVLVGGAGSGMRVVNNSTVVRIRLSSSAGHAPKVLAQSVIADQIPRRNDPNALVIGPTGLALGSGGQLYVADTLRSRIAAIPNAMTRTSPAANAGATVTTGGDLKQPLGLALAPGGDLIAANAGNGDLVEVAPNGRQVAQRTVDTATGAGSLFGLVVAPSGRRIDFVDDGDNTLKALH